MTVCPIAIVASCRKCPVFTVCPLKGVIGDYDKAPPAPKAGAPVAGAKPVRKGT